LGDGINQRQIMQSLLDQGISTRRGIMCSHREPAYQDRPLRFSLPNSEHAQDRGILLPLFQGMTSDEQNRVAEALKGAVARC